MLTVKNECRFYFTRDINLDDTTFRADGARWVGFSVEFLGERWGPYEGVLVPFGMGDSRDWRLVPLDAVCIVKQPEIPIAGPGFEID